MGEPHPGEREAERDVEVEKRVERMMDAMVLRAGDRVRDEEIVGRRAMRAPPRACMMRSKNEWGGQRG